MIFAMHQPNYLPWLGYFDKLDRCDVFVVLDAVQYPRGRSFASRNRILTAQGPQWLTVPASVPAGRKGMASYAEITLAEPGFAEKHERSLAGAYARAPHADLMLDTYRSVVRDAGPWQHLAALNEALIRQFAELLGIDTRIVRMSELGDDFGHKSDLIVGLAGALGADTYLSGDGGGHDYNDEALLAEHGIVLTYQGFTHPEYPQVWGDSFEPAMSVVDLIANCGPDAAGVLRGSLQSSTRP